MDEEMMNVKNIISPYEKRIKELEEIISKKDFEIAVLKQKLYNITKNQNMNSNIRSNEQKEKINIKFIDSKNKETTLKCNPIEKTRKVIEKFLNDSLFIIRELNFTFNKTLLKPYLKLSENGIIDGSVIHVKPKNLMSLIFERNGYRLGMNFDENTSVGMAFIYYLIETEEENFLMNLINNENPISFIYDGNIYSIKNKTSIKNYFTHLSKITIIERGNIIGGSSKI